MTRYIGIHPECMAVRSYSAVSKGRAAIVKVEIEVRDHEQLGWFLREIANAQADCLAAAATSAGTPRAPAGGRKAKGKRAIAHAPTLALPYFGRDDE